MEKEKCAACKGEGKIRTINIMKGASDTRICNVCHGTGEAYKKQTDGVQVGKMLGDGYMFRLLKEGKEMCRINLRVHAVMTAQGVPLAKVNSRALFKRDREVPRCYVVLTRFSEHREKVEELLDAALADPKVEWAEMDAYDAMCYQIHGTLISYGFKIEKDKLVKELTHDEETGNAKPGSDAR